MDVQVTINISREGLIELAEVFKEAFTNTNASKPAFQENTSMQSTTAPVNESLQSAPVPVGIPAPAASASAPASILAQAPVQQPVSQAYSSQIAQQTQLPVHAITGTVPSGSGLPTTAVAQEYTQDQVAIALTGLIDTGRRETVAQILGMFGVQALTQLPKDRYPELVLKLREAGANI